MKEITMNEKTYKLEQIGFEDIIYLEDKGIDFIDMDMTFRNQITLVGHMLGLETIACAKELTQHVRKGGKMDDIMEAINEVIEDSGFTEG